MSDELQRWILQELQGSPGQSARELASKRGIEKRQVNSLLYGALRTRCRMDSRYRWYLSEGTDKAGGQKEEGRILNNTPLARLCRYYLSCLGQDDQSGVSVFAANRYGDLDYCELASLPLDGGDSLNGAFSGSPLSRKSRKEKGRHSLYLGYPVSARKLVSKKNGWEGFFVEPIFLFPLDTATDLERDSQRLRGFPIINPAVLRRFSNADRDSLMYEVIQLEEELGLCDEGEIPDLDDLALRLAAVRPEWPWAEPLNPDDLVHEPPLSEFQTEGIHNRAVLVLAERKPFTQGLEAELKALADLPEADYEDTALGHWLKGEANSGKPQEAGPLIEVLPVNLEQTQAIGKAMTQMLTVITGPPGTGKSQVVTDLLINAAWQGRKVLFVSKNNKAVDVVENRVNGLGSRPILLRMGANEYEGKLATYLSEMMSATVTQEEKDEFDAAMEIQERYNRQIQAFEARRERVVTLRNRVDHLEQSVEAIRQNMSPETFRQIRHMDLAVCSEVTDRFLRTCDACERGKQGFFTRLLWGSVKEKRFAELMDARRALEALDLPARPEMPQGLPTADNLGRWKDGGLQVRSLIGSFAKVREYHSALEELQSAPSLEAIDKDEMELKQLSAENMQGLWQSWVRLQPSRISSEDRRMLQQYAALLKMVLAAGRDRLPAKTASEYRKFFSSAAHLFPCWAVTSLSARGRVPFHAGYFDLVVIDEASQCDIASVLPLLYRAKRVAVIGDPRQLSHITGLPEKQDNLLLEKYDLVPDLVHWSYSANSLFDLAAGFVGEGNLVNLLDHHRSHGHIIGFSNRFFYGGRLRLATRYDHLIRPPYEGPAVRWFDVTGKVSRPLGGSAVNEEEARQVVNLLEKTVLERGYVGSVGVISPFRAQANRIRELVARNDRLARALEERGFLSNTVHLFQGDERDLMIFSPVISEGITAGALGFLKSTPNLFNVAITRARGTLAVVGDRNAAAQSGVTYLADFAAYVSKLVSEEERRNAVADVEYGSEYPPVANPDRVSEWERFFYRELYKAGIKPLPQYQVEKYALDFALINGERRLDIEVDGERYHRNWTGELCRRDQLRNQRLFELGWDVIRFWVYEIRDDTDGCIRRVKEWLSKE